MNTEQIEVAKKIPARKSSRKEKILHGKVNPREVVTSWGINEDGAHFTECVNMFTSMVKGDFTSYNKWVSTSGRKTWFSKPGYVKSFVDGVVDYFKDKRGVSCNPETKQFTYTKVTSPKASPEPKPKVINEEIKKLTEERDNLKQRLEEQKAVADVAKDVVNKAVDTAAESSLKAGVNGDRNRKTSPKGETPSNDRETHPDGDPPKPTPLGLTPSNVYNAFPDGDINALAEKMEAADRATENIVEEAKKLQEEREKQQKVTETMKEINEKGERMLKTLEDDAEKQREIVKKKLEKRLEDRNRNRKTSPKGVDSNPNGDGDEPAAIKKFVRKKETTPAAPPKVYTADEIKNRMDELEEANRGLFSVDHLRKRDFLRILQDISSDPGRQDEVQEVMNILGDGKLSRKVVYAAGDYLSAREKSFKERYKIVRDRLYDIRKHELKDFKRGDKLSQDVKLKITKVLEIFRYEELSSHAGRKKDKIDTLLGEVFNGLGFKLTTNPYGSFDKDGIKYDADIKEMVEHQKGRVNLHNNLDFFTYDMHDIVKIIESELHVKLKEDVKESIKTIVERETRDLKYKNSISHGDSNINKVIVKIERYINSRRRVEQQVFKFSEAGRFTLKEILKKEVASHGMSTTELMYRLQHLIV